MTEYQVAEFAEEPDGRIRVLLTRPDGSQETTRFHPDAIRYRIAEYGLKDEREALQVILHEPYAASPFSPLDDPATAQGWVTGSGPEAEPIRLYNAVSTTEAAGAHRARIEGAPVSVADPEGHLDALARNLAVPPADLRSSRETIDTRRWLQVYGGLPVRPSATDGRTPIQTRG